MSSFLFKLSFLPDKLQRITSNKAFLPEIDGLRFLAIAPVLLQHMNERLLRRWPEIQSDSAADKLTYTISSHGFLGVYLFFIISGFVLSLPSAKRKYMSEYSFPYKSYYIRRLTRIEPPYIITLCIFYILLSLYGIRGGFDDLLPHFLASLVYIHNLIYHEFSPINAPIWSLEIEVQYYIIAPLLMYLFFHVIKSKSLRMIVVIAAMLLTEYFLNNRGIFGMTIISKFSYFIMGILLADLYTNKGSDFFNKKNILYDLLFVVALISLVIFWDWDLKFTNKIIVLISLFALFISVFKGPFINRVFINKWITGFGGMCYTIYLLHLPLNEIYFSILKNTFVSGNYLTSLFLNLFLFLLVLAPICIGFYLLVEKPCMDKHWPEKLKAYLKIKLS